MAVSHVIFISTILTVYYKYMININYLGINI